MAKPPAAITDPQEFERLTNSIAIDMQSLTIHWRLFSDLRSVVFEYETEFDQSRAFWHLTFEAHCETTLYRLCRLYDQEDKALGLRNWLIGLRENDSLLPTNYCRSTLQDDINAVSASDDIVNKLVRLRMNSIAHRAVKPIISDSTYTENCTIPTVDIDTLVQRATGIVDRYTALLHDKTYGTKIVGHDDYLRVLDAVRRDLRSRQNRTRS